MPPPVAAAAAFGVSYRTLGDEDLPFVAALYASTRAEEVAQTGWPAEMQRQFLMHQFDAQHRHYMKHYPDAEWLIVERGGERIGRLYVEEWKDQIRIIDIALTPESRGGGLGAAILRDIQEQARALGKAVSIHVEKHNPARKLYDRLGFRTAQDVGVYDLLEWSEGAAAGVATSVRPS